MAETHQTGSRAHLQAKSAHWANHLLPALLVVSFTLLSIFSVKSIWNMQGNARVINYTGIVRGATQRLVKQELTGIDNDELMAALEEILAGLSKGNKELDLISLPSAPYQETITQMNRDWQDLKTEILQVRQGADSQRLYDLSESFFELADYAVFAAEDYSEERVRSSTMWLMLVGLVFIFFAALFWIYQGRAKKLQISMEAAEAASREKGEFLSQMSHEIRTPMNGIAGMTTLALLSLKDREKVEDCLKKIKLSSDYLLSLINDILDMSRIESGKVELVQAPFDLRALREKILTLFEQKAADAGLAFHVELAEVAAPIVTADELRLSQVVVNMISNAIKFTPAGGDVAVIFQQEPLSDGRYALKITVSDTGIGMSREAQSRIFEPFEQADATTARQYGGTGLGLTISYHLVKMMGGDITLDSAPGKGSRFVVELALPAEAGVFKTSYEELDNTEKNLKGYRILLAEDNPLNSEIAVSLLELKGAAVDPVWNGKEAVDKFLDAPAGRYQLILMDIRMPVLDGLEACRAIRASAHPQAAEIPIIGLSANAFQQDAEAAAQSGMNSYMSKPFDIDKLLSTILGYL